MAVSRRWLTRPSRQARARPVSHNPRRADHRRGQDRESIGEDFEDASLVLLEARAAVAADKLFFYKNVYGFRRPSRQCSKVAMMVSMLVSMSACLRGR